MNDHDLQVMDYQYEELHRLMNNLYKYEYLYKDSILIEKSYGSGDIASLPSSCLEVGKRISLTVTLVIVVTDVEDIINFV